MATDLVEELFVTPPTKKGDWITLTIKPDLISLYSLYNTVHPLLWKRKSVTKDQEALDYIADKFSSLFRKVSNFEQQPGDYYFATQKYTDKSLDLRLNVNYKEQEPDIYFRMPKFQNGVTNNGGITFVGNVTIIGGQHSSALNERINSNRIQVNMN